MPSKKTLLIDFDGTLHRHDGTFSPILSGPLPHARHACHILARTFKLVCFTTREPRESVERWLRVHTFPAMEVTNKKVPAFAVVDDRALCFRGMWTDEFIQHIVDFKPYWKAPANEAPEPFPPQPSDSPQEAE